LDQAVASVDLRLRRPGWWRAVDLVQKVLGVLALVGLGWLAGVMFSRLLGVGGAELINLGPLPVPLLLVVLTLAIGAALQVVSYRVIGLGARRQREAVAGLIYRAVADVAWQQVLLPISEILDAHRRVRLSLAELP
jgi:hypothetical protein